MKETIEVFGMSQIIPEEMDQEAEENVYDKLWNCAINFINQAGQDYYIDVATTLGVHLVCILIPHATRSGQITFLQSTVQYAINISFGFIKIMEQILKKKSVMAQFQLLRVWALLR